MPLRARAVYLALASTLLFSACTQNGQVATLEQKPSLLQALISTATKSGATPVPEKLPAYKSPGREFSLPGAKWVPQSYNNCAPATTSMILQYFGHSVSQVETKQALRTTSGDKNVFTPEIQTYLKNTYNLESKLGFGGDLQMLKTLFTNGFYVMVEDWLHPGEDIGHNTIIRGFDDDRQVVISDDSFIGAGVTFPYDVFVNNQWKAFNREYLIVYTKDKEPLLKAILASRFDDKAMWQHAIDINTSETKSAPNDMYAWFNLGSSYYGAGSFSQAKTAFDKAKAIGWPRRMLWYQIQPIQTYNKVGEYQKALDLIAEGLAGNQEFAELHYEAAVAYKGLGQLDRARSEVQLALSFAPKYAPALVLSKQL
ncbi:MAG TPA: C39 family peptidase [Patescibacteria group bacterium]|nr:C39 family peptidase [Patescibacteria group bacterium]